MATMADIAKKVGVSKGTVSKALNGAPDVSETLRKTILETAVELGYTRARRGAVRTLAVFIENMSCAQPEDFGTDIVTGFRQMAEPAGYEVRVIELNEALQKAAGSDARVLTVQAKYPQGSEKQLIQALTGRRVPSGGLPMDAGCVVINASTAVAISRAVREGRPLIERVLTVDGEVGESNNLRVRIGTEIGAVIAFCGGAKEGVNKVVLGGPMMGQCAFDLQTPVTKGVSGILLFRDDAAEKPLGNCVRCGGCVNVCPVGLMPLTLYALSRKGMYERARDAQHLMDCIECGACAYQCPARLPLVQYIRVAKGALRRAQARA